MFGLAEFAQHLADIAVRGGDFARHGGVLAQFAAQVFTQGEALPEVHQGFVEQAKVVQHHGRLSTRHAVGFLRQFLAPDVRAVRLVQLTQGVLRLSQAAVGQCEVTQGLTRV